MCKKIVFNEPETVKKAAVSCVRFGENLKKKSSQTDAMDKD